MMQWLFCIGKCVCLCLWGEKTEYLHEKNYGNAVWMMGMNLPQPLSYNDDDLQNKRQLPQSSATDLSWAAGEMRARAGHFEQVMRFGPDHSPCSRSALVGSSTTCRPKPGDTSTTDRSPSDRRSCGGYFAAQTYICAFRWNCWRRIGLFALRGEVLSGCAEHRTRNNGEKNKQTQKVLPIKNLFSHILRSNLYAYFF